MPGNLLVDGGARISSQACLLQSLGLSHSAPVQVPSLTFVIFEVGQPLQLVLSGRPRSRPGLWRIRNPLAQGGAARLTMNQISLRSSAQMGRWHVSSSCGLLCGPLKGCF